MAKSSLSSSSSTAVNTSAMTMMVVVMVAMAYLPYVAADAVTIVNQLGEDLVLHCASANNDLGVQTLVNLQEYGFRFRENIWGSTLFWCDFTANGYPPHRQDVYKGDRYLADTCWCTSCNWVVSPKGFSCNGKQQPSWTWGGTN